MATNENENADITTDNVDGLPSYNDHVLFTHINQWENHSIAKIQLAAQQARNDLQQIFDRKIQDFTSLLSTIDEAVETNAAVNTNISTWTEELNRFRQDLSDLSTCIHLDHDKNEAPIRLIKIFHKNHHQFKKIDNNTDESDIDVPGTERLTQVMLSNASLEEQKQMLGSRLFLLVQQIEPNLAAKITGMFLELDNKYIFTLIKSYKILEEKINEAVNILEASRFQQRNGKRSSY
ncbi:unnamed protein product [Rotaria magnacalcarata]|uniref:PABC domain-containing protein n=1 Tax=Rotaria magnacalcarata TaxID=392030 RepID=A0A816A3M2_9BILA|nr:unnamed protein product [Rotaria magnacalcarata]CAF1592604.1 unnamed protein product [Rotaria magnacalcarata]CAF2017170.1 unnamed protein product [Rotaria magnacalcarata]CAF2064079.1 unnamed protein product [Rotaria magnacalcarata]CAF4026633.1 unnamed protein product [Rotaria magnacalcarata]